MRRSRTLGSGVLLALSALSRGASAQVASQYASADSVPMRVPGTPASADSVHHGADRPVAQRGGLRVLPVLSRAPETGFGLGAAIVRVTHNFADTSVRPSTLDGVVVGTQKGQAKVMLEDEVWTPGNRWRVYGMFAFDRSPTSFYGVLQGAKVPIDPLAYYTTDSYTFYATADHQVLPGLFIGAGVKSMANHAVAARPDSIVSSAAGISGHGGRVTGLEQTITYDTRDNIYASRRGSYLLLQHFFATALTGSEYRVERFKVDARTFIPLRTDHVLALQVTHERLNGDIPFEQLPTLGGSLLMRGYVPGQYRDREVTSAQAELRVKLVGRFGMTTWGGGAVVCNPPHCGATWSDVLPTTGVGLRYYLVPAERLSVRMDYGFGRQSHGLYFDFTEAF